MAKQLSPKGTPLFMNVAGQSKEGAQSAISYSAAETIFTAQNATQAFSGLTNLFKTDAPMNADTWAISKGKAITDIVKGDLTRLMSKDMSKADKDKLAAWMELANQVGGVVASAQCSQELAMSLGASNKLATSGGDALTRKVTDTMDNADLYSAIAALTAACNANPVIFLKYPNNFLFTGLGINEDSHNQSHRLDGAGMQGPCIAGAVDNLLKIDNYYAKKFAKLVEFLDKMPEGEGTVLDNTVAVWMNEMSDGNAHNLNNAPIIQAGGGGGYFKTGRIINLDAASGGTATQMLGRSLSQCVPGTPSTSDGVSQGTGTEAKYGNMPVNKYFCNIMNAMGMKADAQGFPAKDGPGSEVTHYGYSDKTRGVRGGQGCGRGRHDPQPRRLHGAQSLSEGPTKSASKGPLTSRGLFAFSPHVRQVFPPPHGVTLRPGLRGRWRHRQCQPRHERRRADRAGRPERDSTRWWMRCARPRGTHAAARDQQW